MALDQGDTGLRASDRDKGKIRMPAVAGRFYPADAAQLNRQIEQFLAISAAEGAAVETDDQDDETHRRTGTGTDLEAAAPGGTRGRRGESGIVARARAVMVPHAGYVYSGAVAGRVFGSIEVPTRVIILAPNHTGRGARVSIMGHGQYRLPGGDIPIDVELAHAIAANAPDLISRDARHSFEAHRFEHAIEVELPFLRARQPALRIVPIVIGAMSEKEALALGRSIAAAVQAIGADADEVLVVASSDMSHYVPDDVARRIDRQALKPLLDMNPSALYRTVVEGDISMCGFIPASAMLAYAAGCGAQAPHMTSYATSGDAFGERDSVVGYAGVIVPA